jgi:hypothetical protein
MSGDVRATETVRPSVALRGWRTARALYRSRWGVLRLSIAAFILWVFAQDTGARLARLQLMALPEFDYAAEVRHLRETGRFGEAVVVADAGIDATSGTEQLDVMREKQATLNARDSFARRARDVGLGALTGSAGSEGEASLERLGGALAADLFVVGDVRDLVIQSARYLTEGEADAVIVALSTIGIATTLAPEIDWVPALMKIAKKASALTRGMEEFIVAAAKSRRFKEAEVVMGDVGSIARHASPAGAVRLLKYADEPADAARLARFVEKFQKGSRGAFALHVTGKDGAKLLRDAEKLGPDAARAAERVVVDASRKGASGATWLARGRGAALLKPHLLVGLGKGLWKGNVSEAMRRVIEGSRDWAGWLMPLVAGWVVLEVGLLGRRVLRPSVRSH